MVTSSSEVDAAGLSGAVLRVRTRLKRSAVSATVPKLRTTFANLLASLASDRVSSSCNARFREV